MLSFEQKTSLSIQETHFHSEEIPKCRQKKLTFNLMENTVVDVRFQTLTAWLPMLPSEALIFDASRMKQQLDGEEIATEICRLRLPIFFASPV